MIYTLPMTKKGTVTIPKNVRSELGAVNKVLLIKTQSGYTFKVVPNIMTFAGKFQSNKIFSDEEVNSAYENRLLTETKYKKYQK